MAGVSCGASVKLREIIEMNTSEVIKKIDEVFADTSVDIETTKKRMREIIEHAEMLLETL